MLKKSIRYRISVSFMYLVIPLVLAVIFFMYFSIRQHISSLITNDFSRLVNEVGQNIDREIYNSYVTIKTLAENPVLKSADISIAEKLQELKNVQKFHPVFDELCLFTADGTVLVSTAYNKEKEWTKNDWFKKALSGQASISPVFSQMKPFRLVMVIVMPVLDRDGGVTKLLTGQVSMNLISSITDKIRIGQSGFIFVTDKTGRLLAYPDKEKLFQKMMPDSLREKVLSGAGLTNCKDENHTRMICYYESMRGYERYSGHMWRIGVIQQKKEAYAFLEGMLENTLLLTVLGIVLVAFFTYRASGIVTRPIHRLIDAVNKIAKGWYISSHVTVSGENEFGELERSFNAMADALQNRTVSHEYVDNVLHAMRDPLVVVDHHGLIVTVNAATSKMTERNEKELVGESIEILFGEEGLSPFKRIVAGKEIEIKEIKDMETNLVSKNGKKTPVLFSSALLGSKRGDATDMYVVCTAKDIAERKRIEQLKDDFISTVSHELRTPITIIKEGISVVHDGLLGDIEVKQKEFLEISLRAIDRLTKIIEDLLDMSKIESGEMTLEKEEFDVVPVIKGVISGFTQLTKESPISLVANYQSPKILIIADKNKLIQVLSNLVDNAVKHTEKGEIEISVEEKELEFQFAVTDSGKGIPEKELPHVFDKFRQFGRENGPGFRGTGLGLAICQSIVDIHNGKIWVTSKLNEGTTVTFTLPKTQTTENHPKKEKSE